MRTNIQHSKGIPDSDVAEQVGNLGVSIPARASATRYQQRPVPAVTADVEEDETYNYPGSPVRRSLVQAVPGKRHQAISRTRLLVLFIFGPMLAWALIQSILLGVTWANDRIDDFQYGPTRTYAITGVFGHNNDSATRPTYVEASNLYGSIIIVEIPAGDPSKAKTYSIGYPLISDKPGSIPVTLSIDDVNHDRKPDVVIHISGQSWTFSLVNTGDTFKLATPFSK